eukprot:UN24013
MFFFKSSPFRFVRSFWKKVSRGIRYRKIPKFSEKSKACQNHEGSCYDYLIFCNPKKLSLSITEESYKI